jgi:hypothetical protein
LDITTALNVDFAQILAMPRQIGQSLVIDMQTAFTNEDLKLLTTFRQQAHSVMGDHITPGDVQVDEAWTPLG